MVCVCICHIHHFGPGMGCVFSMGRFFIFHELVTKGKDRFVKYEEMDFETDRYFATAEEKQEDAYEQSLTGWAKFKYNFADNFL